MLSRTASRLSALLAIMAACGVFASDALSSTGASPVIYQAGRRPAHFYPDNRTTASGFRWQVWSSTEAVGTGKTKTCAPGSVDCSTTTQSITYSRPRRMCGALTYTRFRYSRWPTSGYLSQIAPGICSWYTN